MRARHRPGPGTTAVAELLGRERPAARRRPLAVAAAGLGLLGAGAVATGAVVDAARHDDLGPAPPPPPVTSPPEVPSPPLALPPPTTQPSTDAGPSTSARRTGRTTRPPHPEGADSRRTAPHPADTPARRRRPAPTSAAVELPPRWSVEHDPAVTHAKSRPHRPGTTPAPAASSTGRRAAAGPRSSEPRSTSPRTGDTAPSPRDDDRHSADRLGEHRRSADRPTSKGGAGCSWTTGTDLVPSKIEVRCSFAIVN
jgi:hypothetical protein